MSTPIPEQYQILETFSQNTVANIASVMKSILYDDTDLTTTLPYRNAVVMGANELSLSVDSTHNLIVTSETGNCFINGTLIEFTETKSLDPNDIDSYIYNTDIIPSMDGTHTMYVVSEYQPTSALDDSAYIGFISEVSLLNTNRPYICILGTANAIVSGGVIVSMSVSYDERDSLIESIDVIDGGEI